MIHLVTALAAEAAPLVERFELGPVEPEAPYPLFRGSGISLIVTGVGARAAASAVGSLYGREGFERHQPWINVGLGGHARRPVGEAVVAHKIVDTEAARSFYPPAVFTLSAPSDTVITVPTIVHDYPQDGVYEMEAAGFFAAATRFASAELVHVVKVVSDNRERPPRRLRAAEISELIGGRIDLVERLIDETRALATEIAPAAEPAALSAILARWRFTVTQRRQLERLLRRLGALGSLEEEVPGDWGRLSDAAAVLERLRGRLSGAGARLRLG